MKKSRPRPAFPTPQVKADSRRGIQSVDVAIKILEVFVLARSPVPLSIAAKLAGVAASTTYRYLVSLQRGGLIRQNRETGHYDLGPTALRLGSAAMRRMDAIEAAAHAARSLSETIGETAFVCIWTENGPMIVRWFHGNRLIITTAGIGSVLPPLESTPGQLFFAFLPPGVTQDLRSKFIATGNGPFRSEEDFERRLEKTRHIGYSWVDGAFVAGLRAVAAPVFNLHGSIEATVTLLSLDPGLTKFPNEQLKWLLAAAREASANLGYEPLGDAVRHRDD